MADEAQTAPDLAEPRWPGPVSPEPAVPRSPGPGIWLAAALAFVLGLAAAGWLGWACGADFGHFLGLPPHGPAANAEISPATPPAAPGQTATPVEMALAGRIAATEQRQDRLDERIDAASGNAARAEALLVAFAVRRVVERGAPLGYLGDQLKLRFGDAQPGAVATITTGARDLVPLDQLAARLEELAPQLTDTGQPSLWRRVMRDMSTLFVVRRDRPAISDADNRLDDARKALNEGRIDEAVADVQHLSTGADAASWIAAARRYRDVEGALDLIDTTALLQPHQLHDAQGNPINPVLR